MKRNLALQAGIVCITAILITAGCHRGNKKTAGSANVENDSTKVEVFLKAVPHEGRMHLEMYNGKHPDKKVIDSLYTDVQPGYTVIWKKADQSGIKKVDTIRPVQEGGNIFREEASEIKGLFKLEIPPDAEPGTEKYEIEFTDEESNTWTIDPYLRIPLSWGNS